MIFILSVAYLILVYGFHLRTYIPNADDLINITLSPQSPAGVFHLFTTFGSQYRPLTQSLFAFHRLLMPHFFATFFLNVTLVGFMLSLLIKNLNKVLPNKESLVLGCATLLSPIFFYHIYALSSLNNTLMLILNLIMLLFIHVERKYKPDGRKVVWSFLIFLAALCTKESFLLSAFLFCVVAWQNAPKKRHYWITASLVISGAYVLSRFSQVPSTDPNYGFTFSPEKLLENILLLFPWLVNFPRGWQYGAPLGKTFVTFLISITMALIFVASYIKLFKSNRRAGVFFALALFFSIVPFLFLNRVLVYYVDSAFVLLILLFGYAISDLKDKHKVWIIAGFAALSLIHFLIIHPQWQQYSFVARSNETAQNFITEVKKVDLENYKNLCILNHVDGKWATQDGNLVHYISDSKVHIVSTPQAEAPIECTKDSLVLYNTQTTYRIIDR